MNPSRPARFVLGLVLASLLTPGGPARAAGMKLERERLANLEGPETVGFGKIRFDFQHNFQDYTLLPIADLRLIGGVWDTVEVQAEVLLHNERTSLFGNETLFQFNVTEYGAKWAILDQTREDWFSLAVGGDVGRSDIKYRFTPAGPAPAVSLLKYHLNNRSAFAVAHYDTKWASQYLAVRWAYYEDSRIFDAPAPPSPAVAKFSQVTTPGLGERIKLWEGRDVRVHLIGDFQFKSFDNRFSANAWGAGLQFMAKSPHVFTTFVSNTHGDTGSESVFGSREFEPGGHFRDQEKFYNFRWSYRF